MAGVLRGEKSRFQLFGDTMNTASRIEETGLKNKIHLSQTTAELLVAAGKSSWVKPRDKAVTAKGKGNLSTFWLEHRPISSSSEVENANRMNSSSPRIEEEPRAIIKSNSSRGQTAGMDFRLESEIEPTGSDSPAQKPMDIKLRRLVDYNTEVLYRLIQKMVAMRDSSKPKKRSNQSAAGRSRDNIEFHKPRGMVLDEVEEIIVLPSEPAKYKRDPETVELPPEVVRQLRDYVATIASMYRNNPFHSFDHASHVTMSVMKLLSRVVTPDTIDYNDMSYKVKAASEQLHEYTFGITSDPLTQFAVAFSALIHDVDHPGVPNAQLVKEGSDIAVMYKNLSVAEQNSVDLAWDLLMEPSYADLRQCIYSTQSELERFRQLVVNAVMATDIMDKDLGALRRRRWDKAFNNPEHIDNANSKADDVNRKATIVIEHLIQASDVAHTMQHWHVYAKWNRRLFREMYLAYKAGRSDKDPSETWYEGEKGFFDFYIIPLANKLKECGVFGVSSYEYLDYAKANRLEWELKGRDMVRTYLSELDVEGKLSNEDDEEHQESALSPTISDESNP